ncbi:MAG: ABC transporter ATP-binding protein [Acidimicrobiaceae bacterium]|nr:ABC transporter ATP-binding protein [Acidimicrobiaceae bacterium]
MFDHPGSVIRGPSTAQSASNAGLPHAETAAELRAQIKKVLQNEPEHLEPDVQWERRTIPTGRRFGLRGFLWPQRYKISLAVVLVAAETVAYQFGPVVTQIGIDSGILAKNREVLTMAAFGYLGLSLVAIGLRAARISLTGRVGQQLLERLRIRVFSHMQRLGTDFYMGNKTGVLLARMTSDIDALNVLFQEGIVNLVVQMLTLAVTTALLYYYDPLLATITLLVAVPVTLAMSLWFRRRSSTDYRRVRECIAAVLGRLQESLQGIRVVVAHNRRDAFVVEHRKVVSKHRDAAVRASQANSLFSSSSDAIGVITQAVLLAVGGGMVVSGRITVGELTAYLLFLTAFFAPVQTLVQLYNQYQQGGAAIVRLRELFRVQPTVEESPEAVDLPPIRGEITFDNVSFGYDRSHYVLRDINLSVAAGETVALVGETGAGKTTLARLINRMYDPDEGSVRIDGCDLRNVTLNSLRSQVGVVPQEPFLFAGSVRFNVGFAHSEITDSELLEVLEIVGADDLVARLGGVEGIIQERGATLSSGERQLLALARVCVMQPRVLVFDEATSSLDSATEESVKLAMDVLLEGRTAVVIAHRLDTARKADRIMVIDDGCIVEEGSHDELAAADGQYTKMLEIEMTRKKQKTT